MVRNTSPQLTGRKGYILNQESSLSSFFFFLVVIPARWCSAIGVAESRCGSTPAGQEEEGRSVLDGPTETLDVVEPLGRTTALEALKCALCLLEIGGAFLQFRTVDFGAFVQTGILNRGCCRNSERLSQP